jgi:RNA polymerase sigma-70 factor (ECF subfamily)
MSRSKKFELPIELQDFSEAGPLESQLIDRHSLQDALDKLSAEHREVVLLHEVEGLNYEEAASIIGVPVGTVKSRLHHAFANLRRSLRSFRVET